MGGGPHPPRPQLRPACLRGGRKDLAALLDVNALRNGRGSSQGPRDLNCEVVGADISGRRSVQELQAWPLLAVAHVFGRRRREADSHSCRLPRDRAVKWPADDGDIEIAGHRRAVRANSGGAVER